MRTEEQIVGQVPIPVKFGGKEYQIQLLNRKQSREWRKKYVEMLGRLPYYVSATTDKPDDFKQALNGMLIDMPDTMADLVFEYAKDLPRDEIEAIAADAEIAQALNSIIEVALRPFVQSLIGAITKLSQPEKPSSSS